MKIITTLNTNIPIKQTTATLNNHTLIFTQRFDYKNGQWVKGILDYTWNKQPEVDNMEDLLQYESFFETVRDIGSATKQDLTLLNNENLRFDP